MPGKFQLHTSKPLSTNPKFLFHVIPILAQYITTASQVYQLIAIAIHAL
jgi:hypothetical protein